jgi:hypothetical protein
LLSKKALKARERKDESTQEMGLFARLLSLLSLLSLKALKARERKDESTQEMGLLGFKKNQATVSFLFSKKNLSLWKDCC